MAIREFLVALGSATFIGLVSPQTGPPQALIDNLEKLLHKRLASVNTNEHALNALIEPLRTPARTRRARDICKKRNFTYKGWNFATRSVAATQACVSCHVTPEGKPVKVGSTIGYLLIGLKRLDSN